MPDDYGYPAGAKQRSDYEPFRLVNVWKKVGQQGEGWGARVACPRLCGTPCGVSRLEGRRGAREGGQGVTRRGGAPGRIAVGNPSLPPRCGPARCVWLACTVRVAQNTTPGGAGARRHARTAAVFYVRDEGKQKQSRSPPPTSPQAKTLTKTTYRKASYKSKELMEKFEVWARRERGSR